MVAGHFSAMHIVQLTRNDVNRVAAAWNAALPHDRLTDEGFRRTMLEDPNCEPEGMLVAMGTSGDVIGFSACVLRRTVEGKDGGGREWEFSTGFLKGFFVAAGKEAEAGANDLLTAAEAYCAGAGKTELRLTEYTGPYVYPGLDVRYGRLYDILVRRGFRDVGTIEDVAVDLNAPELSAGVERARARVGPNVDVVTWRPDLLPAMRRFVEEGDQVEWFPAGWEKSYAQPDDTTLVLLRREEIVGWAHFWPGSHRAGFGPTLVLERERKKGYGSLLLLECMERARERGGERMEAGWANTGFYVANGWHITRRYAVLARELSG